MIIVHDFHTPLAMKSYNLLTFIRMGFKVTIKCWTSNLCYHGRII